MGDISKVEVDGTLYNIKDAVARKQVEQMETELPSKVVSEVESYLSENPPQGGSISESYIVNALAVYFRDNPVKDGEDGEDGVSPTVEVSEIEGGHRLTITDSAEEPKFIDILDGTKGEKGDKGVGIQSIEKTSTEGLVDIYTITFTDSSTTEFTVTNGKDGENSSGGSVSDEQISTAVESYLEKNPVQKGDKGDDGVGIAKIEKTSTEDLVDTYTITFTDGNTTTFTVTNGNNEVDGSGTVSDEQIANAVSTYLAENPIEGGMTTEQLNNAISEYLAINPVTNVDEDVFEDMADEFMEDNTIWGSSLPIIFLNGDMTYISHDNAVDITAKFVSQFKEFTDTATLKFQGDSSLGYPKKNFTIKFSSKHGFGWGKQKKWVLKANWIDHSHARNIVSARLWSQVIQSRSDYEELPELLRTSPNHGAIDGFPIKLYLNNVYQGTYTLNIPKGDFQFNMDKTNMTQCIMCSDTNNYNANLFQSNISSIVEGSSEWYDKLHDVPSDETLAYWQEIISFIKDTEDKETFRNGLPNYFDVQSLIDYYLFGYIMTDLDGFGKNQIYVTYDGVRWIASEYDLDSTCGLYSNGGNFVSSEYKCMDDYESGKNKGRKGNKLYEKLALYYDVEIKERYKVLRNGVLSEANILGEFEKFIGRISTEQYLDDVSVYSGIPLNTTNNIKQLRSYVPSRLEYCDGMLLEIDITEMSILDIIVQEGNTYALKVTYKPTNANTQSFNYLSSDTSIFTISDDGIITGISTGTASITVTDETTGLSTSCTVKVTEISETETIFYSSKLSPIPVWYGSDHSNSNDKKTVYMNNDVMTEKQYITVGGSYIAENVIDSGTVGGSYLVLIATNQPLVSRDSYGVSFYDLKGDLDYEVYYANVTGTITEDSPRSFVKAENSSFVSKRVTTDESGKEVVISCGANFTYSIHYANYDIVASSTDNTVTFEANYNQSDYE